MYAGISASRGGDVIQDSLGARIARHESARKRECPGSRLWPQTIVRAFEFCRGSRENTDRGGNTGRWRLKCRALDRPNVMTHDHVCWRKFSETRCVFYRPRPIPITRVLAIVSKSIGSAGPRWPGKSLWGPRIWRIRYDIIALG